ncbi:hypothetical protein GCM10029976_042720 [Kribbella albertanoniae]
MDARELPRLCLRLQLRQALEQLDTDLHGFTSFLLEMAQDAVQCGPEICTCCPKGFEMEVDGTWVESVDCQGVRQPHASAAAAEAEQEADDAS